MPAFNMDNGRHRNAVTVTEAQVTGDGQPVTGVKVHQSQQEPPLPRTHDWEAQARDWCQGLPKPAETTPGRRLHHRPRRAGRAQEARQPNVFVEG